MNPPHPDDELYLFELKKINAKTPSKYDVRYSYAPLRSQDQKLELLPKVMALNMHYTTTFFMPSERPEWPSAVLQSAILFTKLKLESTEELDELILAEPRSKRCDVCHQEFSIYSDHIASEAHIKKQKFNTYSGYVRGLAKKFHHSNTCKRKDQADPDLLSEAVINLEDSHSKPPPEEEEGSALNMLFEGIERESALLRPDIKFKK